MRELLKTGLQKTGLMTVRKKMEKKRHFLAFEIDFRATITLSKKIYYKKIRVCLATPRF